MAKCLQDQKDSCENVLLDLGFPEEEVNAEFTSPNCDPVESLFTLVQQKLEFTNVEVEDLKEELKEKDKELELVKMKMNKLS